MFTGIVTDVGTVRAIEKRGDTRYVIETHYDIDKIDIGASIACSGACLTVVEKGREDGTAWFAVDASAETLNRSNLSEWSVGSRINLERPLRVGDEIGGHIVTGHVDGVGEIIDIKPEGDSLRFTFRVPANIKRYIAPKGSIAIDGVSLTVNEVADDTFGVNIIPHTQDVTTVGEMQAGAKVNLEVDTLARYVARLAEVERG